MRILLDTHAFLWWILGNTELSATARIAISDTNNMILVSAASAWEIATKFRIGKLLGVDDLVANFAEKIAMEEFVQLPISISHALLSGSLDGEHKDPFDRLLIAQSQSENIPIISNERIFDSYGVQRIW